MASYQAGAMASGQQPVRAFLQKDGSIYSDSWLSSSQPFSSGLSFEDFLCAGLLRGQGPKNCMHVCTSLDLNCRGEQRTKSDIDLVYKRLALSEAVGFVTWLRTVVYFSWAEVVLTRW